MVPDREPVPQFVVDRNECDDQQTGEHVNGTAVAWYVAEGVTAVKRTVPDSPARLNADCGLGNEANRRVGEARNAAIESAQSFPKATP